MKIITHFLLLVLFSNSIHAQIKKDQWMIGGRIDFSHSNGDALLNSTITGDSKNTNYAASASFGYFFIDKFCAGLRLGSGGTYTKETYSNASIGYTSESKINSINISPFIRYYFLDALQKINLFADAAYTYSHNNSESDYFQNSSQSHFEYKFNSNAYSIAAGPAFFLNSKVSLELFLKYSFSKINKTGQSGNTLGAGAGFQIHLGK